MGIFLFVVLGIGVSQFLSYFENDRPNFWWSVGGAIGGALAGGVVTAITFAAQEPWDFDEDRCTWYTTESKIVSLNKEKNISGSFVLGTGNISSTTYYYTYLDTKNGYLLDEYRTSKTYIIENGENKVVSHHYRCDMPIASFMRGKKLQSARKNRSHQLFVPKNTIIKEFKL